MLTVERTRNRLLEVDVVTDPGTDLVSLADAKSYSNVPTDQDDTLISAMIKGAVRTCEDWTRSTFITHNVRTKWLGKTMPMRVFRPPIQSISSVTTHYEGTPTVDDASKFYLIGEDGKRPRVYMKSDQEFTEGDIETVSFVCVCGWGDAVADVPEPIIEAVRLTLSNIYDNPDDFVRQGSGVIPLEAQALLAPYQCPTR